MLSFSYPENGSKMIRGLFGGINFNAQKAIYGTLYKLIQGGK
jgi:hypothetical protein